MDIRADEFSKTIKIFMEIIKTINSNEISNWNEDNLNTLFTWGNYYENVNLLFNTVI